MTKNLHLYLPIGNDPGLLLSYVVAYYQPSVLG